MTAINGNLVPLRNVVFVKNLESGQMATSSGIVILDDNMKSNGIRARWAQVYKVGPLVDDLNPGDWVLIKHGRWTHGIEVNTENGVEMVWRVEYPDSVELVSDVYPLDIKPI